MGLLLENTKELFNHIVLSSFLNTLRAVISDLQDDISPAAQSVV